MKKVGTAALKNNLSSYLDEVKKGKEVVITDRGKPIAKLVPIKNSDQGDLTLDERLAILQEQGTLTFRFSKESSMTKKFRRIKLEGVEASDILEMLRKEGQ